MTKQNIAGIVLVVMMIAVGGYIALTPQAIQDEPEMPQTQDYAGADDHKIVTAINSEPAAGEESVLPRHSEESDAETVAAVSEDIPATEAGEDDINVAEIMAPRKLGDENAPVTIEEYASLTCSHCGHFYTETFGQIKKEYIDTGKVLFVYHDFPLNTPARDASIIARCLPKDRYFKFIDFLFETQSKWAYEGDYMKSLMQNAKLLGGSEARLQACLDSMDIKREIAATMQSASQERGIQSTPTFFINGEMLKGAQPFAVFKEKIDQLLTKESSAAE